MRKQFPSLKKGDIKNVVLTLLAYYATLMLISIGMVHDTALLFTSEYAMRTAFASFAVETSVAVLYFLCILGGALGFAHNEQDGQPLPNPSN